MGCSSTFNAVGAASYSSSHSKSDPDSGNDGSDTSAAGALGHAIAGALLSGAAALGLAGAIKKAGTTGSGTSNTCASSASGNSAGGVIDNEVGASTRFSISGQGCCTLPGNPSKSVNSAGSGTACILAAASKICWHWPQRTQPSEMRSWSATTLNKVAQDGQRVFWLIGGGG